MVLAGMQEVLHPLDPRLGPARMVAGRLATQTSVEGAARAAREPPPLRAACNRRQFRPAIDTRHPSNILLCLTRIGGTPCTHPLLLTPYQRLFLRATSSASQTGEPPAFHCASFQALPPALIHTPVDPTHFSSARRLAHSRTSAPEASPPADGEAPTRSRPFCCWSAAHSDIVRPSVRMTEPTGSGEGGSVKGT